MTSACPMHFTGAFNQPPPHSPTLTSPKPPRSRRFPYRSAWRPRVHSQSRAVPARNARPCRRRGHGPRPPPGMRDGATRPPGQPSRTTHGGYPAPGQHRSTGVNTGVNKGQQVTRGQHKATKVTIHRSTAQDNIGQHRSPGVTRG